MAVITPTITLRSNASTATTNAGPLSVALSLAGSDILTVDTVQSEIITPATSGSAPTLLLAGDSFGGDSGDTGGTHGGFLYLKNITSTGSNLIYLGTTLQGASAPANMGAGTTALDNADDATFRLMTLLPGEFAFLPWDYMQDIYVGASAASQSLEYWLFDRG
tara:strand:- start:51 stop:539 length:489 start_codon:yes stop_codon:yes gene_type:complete